MKAFLRLYKKGNYLEVTLPITSQGQPILPSVGDSVNTPKGIYVVNHVTWDYEDPDDITVIVVAN